MDEELGEFPGYTDWTSKKICCCEFEAVPLLQTTYWHHWEVRWRAPIVVTILSISTLVICFVFSLSHLGIEGKVMYGIFLLLFFLFLGSYFCTIAEGPGYFPFYWAAHGADIPPAPDGKSLLPDDDNTYGIISRSDQYQWAQRHRHPPRSIMSRTARRFVLRPDHMCSWAAVWIGKRNQKLFILTNIYGFLYLGLFVVYVARRFVELLEEPPDAVLFTLAIYGLAASAMSMVMLAYAVQTLIDAAQNRTSWEHWNRIDGRKFDLGTLRNMEDVCGPSSRWYCWCWPLSPWRGISTTELARDYVAYRDV